MPGSGQAPAGRNRRNCRISSIPYIAPDGGYLIITKAEGGEELSIHFKKKDGTWTKGIEISNGIGIKGAFCPIVTHDGRYLFFVCGIDGKYAPFWVETSFIQDLREAALKDDSGTKGGKSS